MDAAFAAVLSAMGRGASSESSRLMWFWNLRPQVPAGLGSAPASSLEPRLQRRALSSPPKVRGQGWALGPATVASPTNSCFQSPRGSWLSLSPPPARSSAGSQAFPPCPGPGAHLDNFTDLGVFQWPTVESKGDLNSRIWLRNEPSVPLRGSQEMVQEQHVAEAAPGIQKALNEWPVLMPLESELVGSGLSM